MSSRFSARIVSVLIAFAFASAALASPRGTPAQAKAMLKRAAAHYKAVGEKQALADFNKNKKDWIDRDLYVFCVDRKGLTLANGGFPERVGGPVSTIKTDTGKLLGVALWDAVEKTGSGTVSYSWTNPTSGKIEPKISYVEKLGEMVCGVGAYNPR